MSDSTVLILGDPGPLVAGLAGSFADEGAQVELLLTGSPAESTAAGRAAQRDAGRLAVLPGDPSAIDFGLGGRDYLELVGRTRSVVCVVGAEPRWAGEAERCRGVRAAAESLELVRAGGAKEGVLFLSSLLVFGDARSLVTETDFMLGQGFSGSFEQRLALAEKIVRQAAALAPVSVLRTAPIVGELRPGGLDSGSPLAEISGKVERGGAGAETVFHDLPVRFETVERAVRALLAMWRVQSPNTAHLVDEQPPTDRQLIEWLCDHWNRTLIEAQGVRRARLRSLVDGLSSPERRALSGWPLRFQRSNAESLFPELLDRPFEPILEALFDSSEATVPASGET